MVPMMECCLAHLLLVHGAPLGPNVEPGGPVDIVVGAVVSGVEKYGTVDAALLSAAGITVLLIFTSITSLLIGLPEAEPVSCFRSSCEYTLEPSAAAIMAECCQSNSYHETIRPTSLAENGRGC